MVGKEDPAVLTCQQHFDPTPWINQILIPLSDNLPARRAKWPQRISVEGNTLSQEKRNKEDGLIWHLHVLGLRAQERIHRIFSSWPARIGNRPLTDPCADVIWIIPQIHTDQSVFFLSNTEQFPLSAVEKDRGEAPICSLHEALQIKKILCSSNSHRTATPKFWCFTLKKKQTSNELSRSLSHQFSSGCQLPADFEEACTHLKDLYMHDSLQQEKNSAAATGKRRGHCKLQRFWNPLIKLQLLQNLILSGATSTRCQRKPHSVSATLVFANK